MNPWILEINTDEKIHRFIIRETTEPPYIGREIASVNPYNIVDREQLGKLIALAPEMLETLKMTKKFHDDLFKKGNVPWGQTCGLDFGLMNETLLKVRYVLGKVE